MDENQDPLQLKDLSIQCLFCRKKNDQRACNQCLDFIQTNYTIPTIDQQQALHTLSRLIFSLCQIYLAGVHFVESETAKIAIHNRIELAIQSYNKAVIDKILPDVMSLIRYAEPLSQHLTELKILYLKLPSYIEEISMTTANSLIINHTANSIYYIFDLLRNIWPTVPP